SPLTRIFPMLGSSAAEVCPEVQACSPSVRPRQKVKPSYGNQGNSAGLIASKAMSLISVFVGAGSRHGCLADEVRQVGGGVEVGDGPHQLRRRSAQVRLQLRDQRLLR